MTMIAIYQSSSVAMGSPLKVNCIREKHRQILRDGGIGYSQTSCFFKDLHETGKQKVPKNAFSLLEPDFRGFFQVYWDALFALLSTELR